MEYKKAIIVLVSLSERHPLNAEEKEAVLAAVGALDCASLAQSKLNGFIKAKKAKRAKSLKW